MQQLAWLDVANEQGEGVRRRALSTPMFPVCLDMGVRGHVQSAESCQAAFSPFSALSAFTHVCEAPRQHLLHFNPDDFSGAQWLSRHLLANIAGGGPAKGDLAELVQRCYGA